MSLNEKELDKEFMKGWYLKYPDLCMIAGCKQYAEVFKNDDFGFCHIHYTEIMDEIDNEISEDK